MKKNKENVDKSTQEKIKKQRKYDKGQIFVKVMAGILAVLMVSATAVSVIYAIIGY